MSSAGWSANASPAKFFLEHVAEHGTHGCNYLLTVNIEMDPLDGFKLANWDKGFGDFEMRPDLSTLRVLPWQPGTALVICDSLHHDGKRVAEAPRSVLRQQVERLAKKELDCYIASELEFFLFNNDLSRRVRRRLPESRRRRAITGLITTRCSRRGTKRSCARCAIRWPRPACRSNPARANGARGQHEINFVYDQPLPMADMHVVFKQGVKEIAAQQGKAVTFMPKLCRTGGRQQLPHSHQPLAGRQESFLGSEDEGAARNSSASFSAG